MNASKQPTPHQQQAAPAPELGLRSHPWLRRLIGLAILWHLTAVAVAPFSKLFASRLEPPGGGPMRPGIVADDSPETALAPIAAAPEHMPVLHRLERSVFRRYVNALYLNHGYGFFAPEPGPSFVVEYEVQRKNAPPIRGRLPDLQNHKPRLLYHRYFMLATQNAQLMGIPIALQKMEEGSTETLVHAIARHLVQRHEGERVVLRLFMHRLLWPEEVLQGKSPGDPDTFLLDGQLVFPPLSDPSSQRESPAETLDAEEIRP